MQPSDDLEDKTEPSRRLSLRHRRKQTRERFFDARMRLAFALYGLFALTFSYFQIRGDAQLYFNLLRRFFGEEPDFAYAYQFGSTLWYAPFFLVGKAFGIVFEFQPKTFHVSFEEIAITIGTNVALVVILYLGWRILRELELPRGPSVLFLTVFGTPLFYYVVFDPAGKHAVDTLVLTAATYAFLRTPDAVGLRTPLALGALAGWSANIRVVNVSFFLVLACALLLQGRIRQLGAAAAAAVVIAPLIFALPALRGIPYLVPYVPPAEGAIPSVNPYVAGWRDFNGGVVSPASGQEHNGVRPVSVVTRTNDQGAYTDLTGRATGRAVTVRVDVKGAPGELVRGSLESPIGSFLGFLGGDDFTLDGTWQSLSGVVTVRGDGTLRVILTSQSGHQTFYIDASETPLEQKDAVGRTRALQTHSVARAPLAEVRPVTRSAELEYDSPFKHFDPTIPVKMLFSEHRGLFTWTPLAGFAMLGYLLALNASRGSRRFRSFLLPLLLGAVALLFAHVGWPKWDGGFAFSQRFLTGLFPLYLIGVAELVRRARWVAYPVLVLAAAFSVWLAFVRDVGYEGLSERDGVTRVVEAGRENPHKVRTRVQDDAEARWRYLWGLLHGEDPEHVNGP